jgi:hypothetical protein
VPASPATSIPHQGTARIRGRSSRAHRPPRSGDRRSDKSLGRSMRCRVGVPTKGFDVDSKGFAWIPEDGFLAHLAPMLTRSRRRSCAPYSNLFTHPHSMT